MIRDIDEAIAHAKEVAENLKETASIIPVENEYDKRELAEILDRAEEHEQLADWLEELKARREADRWIPVSEKPPEICNSAYLATVDYGNGIVAACQRFFFNEEIGWNDDCVTHWRPLPEPYKESEATE